MPTARRGHSGIEVGAPPDAVYDLIADDTEPSASGTSLTESFEFLWCSVANRLAEA